MARSIVKQGDDRVRKRAAAFVEFIDKVSFWAKNDHLPEEKKLDLLLDLSCHQRTARSIEKVAQSPFTVALFGPSGSGKSYLVNELVRGKEPKLQVLLGASGAADFLTEINPPGGSESTAQVTRFSCMDAAPPHESYPIHIRLLSCVDIVKILANGYAYECVASEKSDSAWMDEKDKPSSGVGRGSSLLTQEEVYDVQAYVKQNLHTPHYRQLSSSGYWKTLQNVMTCSDSRTQLDCLSLLWGKLEALSELCAMSLHYLREIESEEIWVERTCLVPRENQSVIDVDTLKRHLRTGGDDKVKFLTSRNLVGEIQKSRLAALTAELVLPISRHTQGDLVTFADILDFPGARARGNAFSPKQLNTPPGDIKEGIDPLCEVFLRGKIAYLFERYVELRDINSLLLCLPPGEIEALSLPSLIRKWVDQTHGPSHIERGNKDANFFAVFTKFDQTLTKATGEPADSPRRWESRLRNSFSDFFRKAYGKTGSGEETWTERWDRSGAFSNCYWVRNPQVHSGIFEPDTGTGAERFAGDYERWIGQLKGHYSQNPFVKKYFPDAERKWDEVARPGHNGIALLDQALKERVKPEQKREQLHLQMDTLYGNIKKLLKPYIVDVGRVQAAEKLATELITELKDCFSKKGAFGIILDQLGISEKLAADLYEKALKENHVPEESESGPEGIDWGEGIAGPQPTLAGSPSRDNGVTGTNEDEEDLVFKYGYSAKRLSGLVLEAWQSNLYGLNSNQEFLAMTALSPSWCQSVAEQLVLAAERRFSIRKRIAECSSDALSCPDPLARLREQAFLISAIMNNFVSCLGDAPIMLSAINSGNPKATGRSFPGQMYFDAWTHRLKTLYMENAGVTEEVERSIKASRELEKLLEGYACSLD